MILFALTTNDGWQLTVAKGTGDASQAGVPKSTIDYRSTLKKISQIKKLPPQTQLLNPELAAVLNMATRVTTGQISRQKIYNNLAYETFIQNCNDLTAKHHGAKISSKRNKSHYKATAQKLVSKLQEQKTEVIALLNEFEPLKTAQQEYEDTLNALNSINEIDHHLDQIAANLNVASVFLPINLPLYSFLLYAFTPALALQNVFIRCPLVTRTILKQLFSIINLPQIAPQIKIIDVSRQEFNAKYVNQSDLIIFTGKPQNANALLNDHADKLFIYNGYGVNPIIVHDNADIDLAVAKVVKMRTFNSGQDCGAPDAILVQHEIYDMFINKLKTELDKLRIGQLPNPSVDVGPLLYPDKLLSNLKLITSRTVHYGGLLDYVKNIFYPTIIESDLDQDNYHEFFAPVFNTIRYKDRNDLKRYFHNRGYLPNTMYASIFGSIANLAELVAGSVILQNQVILDVDAASDEFGGFGRYANFVHYKGKKASFPSLIPRDIANCLTFGQPIHHPPFDRSPQGLDRPSPKNPAPQAFVPSSYPHHQHSSTK